MGKETRGREGQRKRIWENWKWECCRWDTGKHLGSNEKNVRQIIVRDEKRKQNKCVFFYDSPYLGCNRGLYFALKRDNPAVHIRIPSSPHAEFITFLSFKVCYGSPLFLFVLLSLKENAPTFRHYKFVPWPCLTRSPHATEIHEARHKTFLAWFLPSIMYSVKERLDRIVSRQT